METIEIELRYQILNPDTVGLLDNMCTFHSEKRIIDHYLDTPSIDLLKRGINIRVRDSKKMDIKFNRDCLINPMLELQDSGEEYSFSLPLQQKSIIRCNEVLSLLNLRPLLSSDFELFKQQNNLINHRIIDKVRRNYTTNGFTIVIDEVKSLGSFLEIEVMASSSENIEEIAQRMRDYLLSLSALNLKPLKTGYDSLILRKHNFQEYLQGRFILEEDNHHLKAVKRQFDQPASY
ncbi:CYTH domain-containing protein [Candidatus Dependentiae bacterium]|nr:CYTH domain-containing protein [Candidatus Dependentiae bacterium]